MILPCRDAQPGTCGWIAVDDEDGDAQGRDSPFRAEAIRPQRMKSKGEEITLLASFKL
jgi:hypothetical protein